MAAVSAPDGSAVAAPRSRGSLALLVHSWLGLKLSVVLLFVVLLGCAAVFSYEIEWLIDERVRVQPSGEPAPLGELLQMVETQRPTYRVHSILLSPRDPPARFELPLAVRVEVVRPDGAIREVLVDPYQHRITGERSYYSLPFVIRQLHWNLFVYPYGFYLVAFLGVMVLGGLVTGLMSYPRFWRGFLRPPKLSWGPRTFWPALHRWLGLWISWFVFVIGATAVYYLVQDRLAASGSTALGRETRLSSEQLAAVAPHSRALPLDVLIERATQAFPGFSPRYVHLPAGPGDTLQLWGQGSAAMVRDFANQVHLNPYNGEVVWLQDAAQLDPVRRLAHTADRLHFGSLGGLPTRLLWFCCGLLLAALIASGTVVHVRRAVKLTRDYVRGGTPGPSVDAAARKLSWKMPWLGWWRWLNALLLIAATIGACIQYAMAGRPT